MFGGTLRHDSSADKQTTRRSTWRAENTGVLPHLFPVASWLHTVSKNRPSSRAVLPISADRGVTPTREDAAYWRHRLFKNSYTYKGRLARVRSWSVKLQHRGQRRTFSLTASRKEDAAQEACQLYQKLVTEGWEAVGPEPPRLQEVPKSNAAFWKQRLVRRPHHDPTAPVPAGGFSVRIVHEGAAWYFPLGSDDERHAAERAGQIHLAVLKKGWAAACSAFSRELAVAVHWAANPLVWTYATLHTQITSPPRRTGTESPSECTRLALIEPDAGIRQALAYYVDRHPGFRCAAAFGSAAAAFEGISRSAPQLVLVNHHLPDMEGPRCVDRLRPLVRGRPCLLFSVYEDSVELFKSTTGGSAGYLLKRTLPDQLLAPLSDSALPESLSSRQISRRVWKYFQELLVPLQSGDAAAEMEKLSPRECQVLDCLSRGYVDKEIAATLGISAWTVHGHLKNIFEKLGAHSRTEAVVKYLQR
jgi:DNA-binding NarL/FixJ family response regulator